MRTLILAMVLLAVPWATPCPAGDDQNVLPEWKSSTVATSSPPVALEQSSDVPVYIGTTGFAWAVNGSQESRRRWSLVSRAFGLGGFLFSHGPVGNFSLLGGARTFHPRASFFSGFGIRHNFAFRRKR